MLLTIAATLNNQCFILERVSATILHLKGTGNKYVLCDLSRVVVFYLFLLYRYLTLRPQKGRIVFLSKMLAIISININLLVTNRFYSL